MALTTLYLLNTTESGLDVTVGSQSELVDTNAYTWRKTRSGTSRQFGLAAPTGNAAYISITEPAGSPHTGYVLTGGPGTTVSGPVVDWISPPLLKAYTWEAGCATLYVRYVLTRTSSTYYPHWDAAIGTVAPAGTIDNSPSAVTNVTRVYETVTDHGLALTDGVALAHTKNQVTNVKGGRLWLRFYVTGMAQDATPLSQNAIWHFGGTGSESYITLDSTMIKVTGGSYESPLFGWVNANADIQWRTFSPVSSDLQTLWQVYKILNVNLTMAYNVYTRVDTDADIEWHVLAPINVNLTTLWNTLSNLTLVEKDATVEWHVIKNITQGVDIAWNVKTGLLHNLVTVVVSAGKHTIVDLNPVKFTSTKLEGKQ
jgi:hypothetical protein